MISDYNELQKIIGSTLIKFENFNSQYLSFNWDLLNLYSIILYF